MSTPISRHPFPVVTAQLVYEELRTAAELRKLPHYKRWTFSVDLALVAAAIRPGHLVDTFVVKDPVGFFSSLLQSLRKISSEFKRVHHLFEPASSQSFLVNAESLREILPWPVHEGPFSVSFVEIHTSNHFQLLSSPPPRVVELFAVIGQSMQDCASQTVSVSLPVTPVRDVVPLAAILLGYLIAYVPADTQAPLLSQVPLDVYECVVDFPLLGGSLGPNLESHTLLKFSCPCEVLNAPRPLHVVDVLKEHYQGRIQDLIPGSRLRVIHTIVTLDRVAL